MTNMTSSGDEDDFDGTAPAPQSAYERWSGADDDLVRSENLDIADHEHNEFADRANLASVPETIDGYVPEGVELNSTDSEIASGFLERIMAEGASAAVGQSVIRHYVEWADSMQESRNAADQTDVQKARGILQRDFGPGYGQKIDDLRDHLRAELSDAGLRALAEARLPSGTKVLSSPAVLRMLINSLERGHDRPHTESREAQIARVLQTSPDDYWRKNENGLALADEALALRQRGNSGGRLSDGTGDRVSYLQKLMNDSPRDYFRVDVSTGRSPADEPTALLRSRGRK